MFIYIPRKDQFKYHNIDSSIIHACSHNLSFTFDISYPSLSHTHTVTKPSVSFESFGRLVNVGHLLNGLAGPVAMGAPPFLSAVWFPLHQRATATAVSTSSNFVGVAMAFVLGVYHFFSKSLLFLTPLSTQMLNDDYCCDCDSGPNLVPQLTSPESVFINTTQIPSSVRSIDFCARKFFF